MGGFWGGLSSRASINTMRSPRANKLIRSAHSRVSDSARGVAPIPDSIRQISIEFRGHDSPAPFEVFFIAGVAL